jgi:hypothetical protein
MTSESVSRSSSEAVALALTGIISISGRQGVKASARTQNTNDIFLVSYFSGNLGINALHRFLLSLNNFDRRLVHNVNNLFQVLNAFRRNEFYEKSLQAGELEFCRDVERKLIRKKANRSTSERAKEKQ